MSLAARVALGACLVLVVFVAFTALALEQAFHNSARSGLQERLLGQTFLLMAAAEVDPRGRLSMPPSLPEARFEVPGSGLYGQIVDGNAKLVWQSASSLTQEVPPGRMLGAGERVFAEQRDAGGRTYLLASYGVRWASESGVHPFTFVVAEELSAFFAQIEQFRRTLWGWLGAMALLLVLAQVAVLRWGLQPLRAVARELGAIEAGRQQRLDQRYPKELQPLTASLNHLLEHERAQQRRYRDALADLAHSLKTPLAVLRGALGEPRGVQIAGDVVEEQVARMDHIVRYQLQRASTTGWAGLGTPVMLRPVLVKLIDSLDKVYRDKAVQVHMELAEDLSVRAGENDLMELLGNVLDNAYKWCRGRVRVESERADGKVHIRIEDDGPGVSTAQLDRIFQRGVRADERVPGHGLGLAIVRDILEAYQGEIDIGKRELGGAAVRLVLPGA